MAVSPNSSIASSSTTRSPSPASSSLRKYEPSPPASPGASIQYGEMYTEQDGRCEALESLSVVRSHEPATETPRQKRPLRAYLAVFGGFLLMFNSWGMVNAYGTYASIYKQELLPSVTILLSNLVGSTQTSFILLLSSIVGRLLDAGFSMHFKVVGTVCTTLSPILLSFVNGDGHYNDGKYDLILLVQGILWAIGMGCFFVTSSTVAVSWYREGKGLIVGMVASGASIAGLVFPIAIRYLEPDLGFNNTMRVVAGIVGGTGIIACLIANPNPDHPLRKPDNWLDYHVWVDPTARKNKSYCWYTASIAFVFLGFYAIFFNLEEWAVSTGVGYKTEPLPGMESHSIRTTFLLAVMNGCSTVGRLSSSYLCDLFGALAVHSSVTFVAAVLTMCLWPFATNLSAALGFVITFGIFSGSVIGLPPACVATILGPDEQHRLGQWVGMMYTAAGIPALVGPIIAGYITSEHGYIGVQMWSGTCLFFAALCMVMAWWNQKSSQDKMKWLEEQKRRLSFESAKLLTQRRISVISLKDSFSFESLVKTFTRRSSVQKESAADTIADEKVVTEKEIV